MFNKYLTFSVKFVSTRLLFCVKIMILYLRQNFLLEGKKNILWNSYDEITWVEEIYIRLIILTIDIITAIICLSEFEKKK